MGTADMLSDLGYTVIEVASGTEALDLARTGVPFDLLVNDHPMPGTTGEELVVAIRDERPGTPALLVSDMRK
jgi:CheY-like chemotaxis protein